LGLLLDALALLPKDLPWLLTVVGTGKSEADFKNQAQRLKLNRKVKFVGEIFGTKTIQFFQQHEVFCAPYFDEGGTSLSIIEAMACGLPIVGFENPAFGDVMAGYPAPELFVPIRNVTALTAALIKIINQPKLRQTLGLWSANRAKKFNWPKQAEKTLEVYRKILAH
jgi:glycosyltransferase involved in cell wall biosynthesis